MNYPDGIDCLWLACDRDDKVAAFVTAGCAPVPVSVLETPRAVDAGNACDDLDAMCDAESLLRQGDPTSFLALARRGLQVYDWQDVHRSRSQCSGKYELVARPTAPCRLDDLPASLANLARAFRFEGLAFGQSSAIDPRQVAPCEQGGAC